MKILFLYYLGCTLFIVIFMLLVFAIALFICGLFTFPGFKCDILQHDSFLIDLYITINNYWLLQIKILYCNYKYIHNNIFTKRFYLYISVEWEFETCTRFVLCGNRSVFVVVCRVAGFKSQDTKINVSWFYIGSL